MLEAPKICHLTSVHAPLDDRIFYREAVTLAEAGYRVVIVAPADKDQELAGVRIRAIPQPPSRWERMTKTAWNAYRAALDEHADLYHFHDPELAPFGFLLRLSGKRVIYDAHEDLPDDIMAKDWIPRWLRAPLAFVMRALTQLAGAVCSGIVAATPHIAKRFPAAKTALVQNFPRPAPAAAAPPSYNARPKTVVYVGSITKIRGIVEMVEAFTRPLTPSDARLVIAGSFGTYGDPELEKEIRSSAGWQRVEFVGWRSHAQIHELLQNARAGLVVLHPKKSFIESHPTKLFEYMAAGIPVIASDFPLWRDIVEGAGCGIVVDPLDCDAIAGAIALLLGDPERAEQMGRRGQQAVRSRYNWGEQAERLLSLYGGLLYDKRLAVVGDA